jgi:hypothetical protein
VTLADQPPDEGWECLFNGKDLTGWKVPEGDNGHWKVVDGVIDYDALSEAPGDRNLWTEESFGDFVLRIDWRFKRTTGEYAMPIVLPDGTEKTDENGEVIKIPAANADSGIFLRGTGKAQVNLWCWPIGSGELWSYRKKTSTPEVRAGATPKVRADKPVGEWNSMEITMQGDRVTIVLNGKTVIDNAQMPGVPETGPIGLQHHGGRLSDRQRERLEKQGLKVDKGPNAMSPASSLIQFRNIQIKRLDGE